MAATLAILVLTVACGSSSGGHTGDAVTTISLLVDNSQSTAANVSAILEAFEAKNPGVRVEVNTRPVGPEGDDLVKTKLSTGTMQDVFWSDSGPLFPALDPEKNLVDLTGTPAVANADESFLPSVSVDGTVYGAPWGDILRTRRTTARSAAAPTSWGSFPTTTR